MGDFVKRVPPTFSAFKEQLEKLYENKGHVSGIKVDESQSHLLIDLDWSANRLGGESGKDFYLPIKRGKLGDAKALSEKMLRSSFNPSNGEMKELFDMIDVTPR